MGEEWGEARSGVVGNCVQGHGRSCTGIRGKGHVGCRSGRGVGVYGRSGGVAVLAIVMGVLLVPVQAGT